MKQILLHLLFLLLIVQAFAKKIPVRTMEELNAANKSARPGDTVELKNGVWMDAIIKLDAKGTEKQPIIFKAQTNGKVILAGASQLRLGGEWIVVEGLLFEKGFTPDGPVIEFRTGKDKLANNCRLTQCMINDFNKLKRLDDDNWIALYGRNNRIDHCSFFNKKNLGVLLAVILDDERSRENNHSIDHNYFGIRPPLGSNGGEIIRVGVSQHAEFNSRTQITNNRFLNCDGEAEIISIKSCKNRISGNLFQQSQGSVVLRHGDDNVVTDNVFLGYGKEATGGVRVINKGQWVVNNFFYQCTGTGFRAPLTIMNGIPNSPAHRYVQVTDAVIMNNSFVDCAPLSFCEGSDTERTLPPDHVLFANNIFYKKDSLVYRAFDRIDGIRFVNNKMSKGLQETVNGFEDGSFTIQKADLIHFPLISESSPLSMLDSLLNINREKKTKISTRPGFSDLSLLKQVVGRMANETGAGWYVPKLVSEKYLKKAAASAEEIYRLLLDQSRPVIIQLTGTSYTFNRPMTISGKVEFLGSNRMLRFQSAQPISSAFLIGGNGHLILKSLNVNASGLKATNLIANDTSGHTEHYNLVIRHSSFEHLEGCENIFQANPYSFADSIVIDRVQFRFFNNGFLMDQEKDNKGYYSAEKIRMSGNSFSQGRGRFLSILRGGNDESTLGPQLEFRKNTVDSIQTGNEDPLFQLTGVQKTLFVQNTFRYSNPSRVLIRYTDTVKALHLIGNNTSLQSGTIGKNKFVTAL
jgi:poly(beta-D-mannuronate) lyase